MTALMVAWAITVVAGGWIYRARPGRSAFLTGVGAALLWPPLGLLPPALGWLRRRAKPLACARRDRAAVNAELPDAIDLLLVAIHAGLTPEQALRRLQPYLHGVLYRAVDEVFVRVGDGQRFGDALDALADIIGEPARPLVAALAGSERYGLPLGPALDLVATTSRDLRRRTTETAARKLPVRLSFPLVLCILPAFIVLTVVPAILGALRALP